MEGKRVLMIVDEAQNLPKDALEELRMLSNFELSGKSLFQTFLIGQQQLSEALLLPEMEQLKQRIVATYQLKALNAEETKNYILFRLEKAGWQNTPQFEDEVFNTIYSYSEGIPRRINTFCDRVLLFGYLDELKVINLSAIEKVIADIEDESSFTTVVLQEASFKNSTINNSVDERILSLEKTVINLQQTIAKERALLRKAILLQLDMDTVYEEPL